jgi:hypothetical protein
MIEKEQPSNLRFIYNYYCKLNQKKIKHQNFDDVSNKAEMIDLH